MKRFFSVFLTFSLALPVLCLFPGFSLPSHAQKEEPRKTPIMGWASWNAYRTDIDEEIILSQAEKLVELGLADAGYIYVNVDDGWQKGRDAEGYVYTHPDRFPSGMKNLADTLHQMGLKAGIYSDAGASTCGWESDHQVDNDDVGLLNHEEQDLYRYLDDWGYDFIKVDWCGGRRLNLDKKTRYTMIGDIVKEIEKKTGKDKIYNVCCWSFPGEWVTEVADSWRTGGDIFNNFGAVLEQLDNIKSLAKYNTPGHVNDLDMMQVGNGLSYEEDKSHFSMWCMMSTPLVLGMDLNSISDETLSIISNRELIALNQDPACVQATVAKSYGSVEVWSKDLGSVDSDTKAFALLNRSNKETTVTVRFEEVGLKNVSSLRDLWAHTDIPCDGSFRVTIPAHGTVVLKASGEHIPVAGMDDPTKVDDSVVSGSMNLESKPKTVNLTALGSYDWAHFGSSTTHMKNGAGEIQLEMEASSSGSYGNAYAKYIWTNGDETPYSTSDTSGFGVYSAGSYLLLYTPCDRNPRTLKAAVGSYSADMKIELIVGGKTLSSETVKGAGSVKRDKLVIADYQSDRPTYACLKITVEKDLGSSASVNIEGVGLNIEVTENALGTPHVETDGKNLTVSLPVYSTEEEAALYLAVKDTDGALVSLEKQSAKKGAAVNSHSFALSSGFAGTLHIYFWKEGVPLCPERSLPLNLSSVNDYSIGKMTAQSLLNKGAVLLDVRSAEEFAKGHLEGAVHLDYSEVATKALTLLPDQNKPIVVYCSAAKRSAQAVSELIRLGYTAVYNLGSMQNFYAEPMITFSKDSCTVLTQGEKPEITYTCNRFDQPEVYISLGRDSEFRDAHPLSEFTLEAQDCYYLTLKAYLAYDGVCYAQCEKQFIYWSEQTVLAFATDLNWTKSTCGWGEIRKNRSIEGNPLRLSGKTFTKGIGTHATSEIAMDIPAGADKFLAVVGCDEEISGSNTMMFFVRIDGKTVAHSSLIKPGQHFVFDVDIPEGAQEILLYTFEGTYGGNTCDHADWAVAGFFKNVKEK